MNGVDASKLLRTERKTWRKQRRTAGQEAIQGIQKESLSWPSVF